jgi:DNA-binding Lrp family transcriptional regulator
MGADHYDFDADRWDFDWNTAKGKKEESRDYSPSHVGKFDFEDLMLIKELQLDATRSLREIAAKLRVGYKKALRHFHHVTERRLIHGYKITWSKDAIDLKREASPVIRHKYLPIFLLVKNPSISESRRLKLASERLPYLSAEAYGKDYFAEILLPLEQSIQGLQYLRKSTEQVKERSDFGLIDPEYSLAFTISYQLYDQRSRQWTFDTGRVLESVENLMITRNETKHASRENEL